MRTYGLGHPASASSSTALAHLVTASARACFAADQRAVHPGLPQPQGLRPGPNLDARRRHRPQVGPRPPSLLGAKRLQSCTVGGRAPVTYPIHISLHPLSSHLFHYPFAWLPLLTTPSINMYHIKTHYFSSHPTLNPYAIVPVRKHGRSRASVSCQLAWLGLLMPYPLQLCLPLAATRASCEARLWAPPLTNAGRRRGLVGAAARPRPEVPPQGMMR